MPSRIDTLIADCASWTDFRDLASRQKNTKDMGDLFERLTQLYLQTHPTYRSKIKNVWWCNNGELPEEVRKKLNLPDTDEGIDLLCETYSGEYWSVQSKYQTNSERPLNYRKLSTFLSLSFVTAKGISTGLVVHTSTKKVKKSHLMGNTVELGLQHWLDITDGQWDQILDVCRGNLLQPPEKRNPRKYQKLAIQKAKLHFLKQGHSRGKLIMPCGTGKSLIAYWSTKALKAKSVIVAVPSLALVKQSLEDWTSEFLAEGIHPEWMAVCSDDSVGNMKEADSTLATVYESGIPTTTDPIDIAKFVNRKSNNPKVIFTTYQSSQKLADACLKANLTIDLLIADEAHKTVGRKDKGFAALLDNENIKINQRLYMTATERVFRQASDDIVSMDDESIYGKIFYQMSFKQAIKDEIICDYKILTVAVSEREVSELITEKKDVMAQLDNQKVETDAHNLAAGIALGKVYKKYHVKRVITFHRSIKRAENFAAQQEAFQGRLSNDIEIENHNISSKLSAGQRSQVLNNFTKANRSLISNARCLTEGVDIPSIDCIAFIDPKHSIVDIVQAAGRAMRRSKETEKNYGYILLPVIVPEGKSLEEFSETTDFAAITRVIIALSQQDERIVEELRSFQANPQPSKKDVIEFDDDILEILDLDYQSFYKTINLKLWSGVGRSNWRPFNDAKKFVSSLNITSSIDWRSFIKDNLLPPDIPRKPDHVYRFSGWQGWGDWLGTDRLANKNIVYRSFKDARTFVRSLGLKTSTEWNAYRTSGRKPDDIPSNPNVVYPSEIWKGYGDWLGTGRVANQDLKYLSYEQAKKYLSKFNLKSRSEYESWHASNQRDASLPKNPEQTYKRQNIWISWGDFLDTGYIAHKNRVYVSYDEACSFIRSAGILSFNDFKEFSKSGKKPDFIPSNPHKEYEGKGWVSYGEFFGTGVVAKQNLVYRPFEEARAFVHTLGLKQSKDWKRYVASGEKPDDIPSNIHSVYKDDGFINMGDWLGTGKNRSSAFEFRKFSEARAFVRTLNFKNRDEYTAWAKTSEKPYDIPADPRVYDKDYTGWSDWLGNGYLAYEQAKKIVHTFNIQTSIAWRKWASSKDRPQNIPSIPQRIYANAGWRDWDDWLGREVSPEILERAQRWEQSFRKLQMFKDREGHCKVPSGFIEDGFNLGSWTGIQRTTQASMPPERKQKLNEIGFVWDTYALAWEKGFNALMIFRAREGHCSVPATHKEGDHSLGSWVRNQRRSESKLLAERKKRLDDLGFIWGGRDF